MQNRSDRTTHIHRPQWFIAGLIALILTEFISQLLQARLGQVQPMPTLWLVGTVVTLFCMVRSAQSPSNARTGLPTPLRDPRS